MAKRKLYELKWEILSSAELISKLPPTAKVPLTMIMQIYSGNGLRLIIGDAKPRKWGVTIETKAKAEDGCVHTVSMNYSPDDVLYLSELMNGVKHAWIDRMDEILNGMDAISAHAVARCLV